MRDMTSIPSMNPSNSASSTLNSYGHQHPAPSYQLTIGEEDITPKINPRLISLTLTKCRSDEADTLDMTLDDFDGQLAIPPQGVMLQLAIGYRHEALVDKGSFIVDEVSHEGVPDRLTIRARSADLTSDLRRRRTKSWHNMRLGAIIEAIAANNGLSPRIDERLAALYIGHIDQSSESDIAFITRLARHFDAVATVKNTTLIFLPINDTRTSKDEEIPTLTIHRKETTRHTYTACSRDGYTGVRAFYDNAKAGRRESVLMGAADNPKELAEVYASKDDAQRSAESEWQRLERGVATLSLSLAKGSPDFMPQSIVKVTGFKEDMNALTWLAVRVVHSLNKSGGLSSSLELEVCSQKTKIDQEKKGTGNGSGGGFWK